MYKVFKDVIHMYLHMVRIIFAPKIPDFIVFCSIFFMSKNHDCTYTDKYFVIFAFNF